MILPMLDRLIDLLVSVARWFRFWTVVEVYKRGVRLRLGINPTLLEPGFHFLIPFGIDQVIEDHIVPRVHRPNAQTITLKDGVTVVLEPIITFKVNDMMKFVLEVDNAQAAILDTVSGEILTTVAAYTWPELLEQSTAGSLRDALTKSTRKLGFKWGIEILKVGFSSIGKVRNLRLISTTTQRWEEPD